MLGSLELALPLALASSLFFGVGKVLDKKGLAGGRLLVGVLYTLMVGPPVLLLYSALNGDLFTYQYNLLAITHSAIAGIFNHGIGTFFLYASIRTIGAARASVMSSTQVIFAPLLSIAFFAETMSPALAVGTAIIFLGLVWVSFSTPGSQENGHSAKGRFKKGYTYGLVSGFFWGASHPFTRLALIGFGSPVMVSLFSYVFAILPILLILLFTASKARLELKKMSKIYLSGSGTLRVLAALSRSTALSLAPVVLVIPFASLSPLVTVLVSYLVIQRTELINRNVFFGAIAVVAGAAIIAMFT